MHQIDDFSLVVFDIEKKCRGKAFKESAIFIHRPCYGYGGSSANCLLLCAGVHNEYPDAVCAGMH